MLSIMVAVAGLNSQCSDRTPQFLSPKAVSCRTSEDRDKGFLACEVYAFETQDPKLKVVDPVIRKKICREFLNKCQTAFDWSEEVKHDVYVDHLNRYPLDAYEEVCGGLPDKIYGLTDKSKLTECESIAKKINTCEPAYEKVLNAQIKIQNSYFDLFGQTTNKAKSESWKTKKLKSFEKVKEMFGRLCKNNKDEV